MRIHLITLLGSGLLLGADAPQDDATKKDLARLQGAWKIVALEYGGETQDLSEFGGIPVEFKDNQLRFGNNPELKFTFLLDATFNPGLFDLTVTNVRKEKKIERVHEGIYSLDGDTLKICVTFTPDLKERPLEFSAKADSGKQLIILKRDK